MRYFPIFFDLDGCYCLVIGGGVVAHRKISLLSRTSANIVVVAKSVIEDIKSLKGSTTGGGSLSIIEDEIQYFHLEGALPQPDVPILSSGGHTNNIKWSIVYGATDDRAVNKLIYDWCKQLHLSVNIVDCPSLCTFISPAIVDRTPIVIAIGTEGCSPSLARHLRTKIETFLPHNWSILAKFVSDQRQRLKESSSKIKFSGEAEKRLFWDKILNGPIASLVLSRREHEANLLMNKLLDEYEKRNVQNNSPGETKNIETVKGFVWIVGAGPGDADLLTIGALRAIQQADVILYDRLVTKEILDLSRRDATMICVGKTPGSSTDSNKQQEHIHQLMIENVQMGQYVCRLKGGDPMIFGRGSEEAEALVQHNIPYKIIPGITAALGCAASVGIPLTFRGGPQGVRLCSGHKQSQVIYQAENNREDRRKNIAAEENPDEVVLFKRERDEQLEPNERDTIALYMGVKGLPKICEDLVDEGWSKSTPLAIIQEGTTKNQKVVTSTLGKICLFGAPFYILPPALVIVGSAVNQIKKLRLVDPDQYP